MTKASHKVRSSNFKGILSSLCYVGNELHVYWLRLNMNFKITISKYSRPKNSFEEMEILRHSELTCSHSV